MQIKVLASGSKGNCYTVSDGVTTLMLDCGIPYKEIQQKLNFKISSIDACLVSHARHSDHSKSIKDLLNAGIDVYTTPDNRISHHRIHELEHLHTFFIKTLRIITFVVHHDVPCFGFLIKSNETGEKLVYITDTSYVDYKFSNLNYAMVECNYSKGIMHRNIENGSLDPELAKRITKTHFSLENVIDMLKESKSKNLKQIYLLHLSDANSDADMFKSKIQQLFGCEVYVC